MIHQSSAKLYLHGGHCPPWLWSRMTCLGSTLMQLLVEEYKPKGVLERLSDTFFFQSLSNVLGFDWNSSGTTTVLCGVLGEILSQNDFGLKMAGGKGKKSRQTVENLKDITREYDLGGDKTKKLVKTSRLTAKVDSTMIQAGYNLYHHSMFVSQQGDWAVVQQGMNNENKCARRYHWLGFETKSYVEEPHKAITCDHKHKEVLDLCSKHSSETRKTMLDLVREKTSHIRNSYEGLQSGQRSLKNWESPPQAYECPRRINWDALERLYEIQPGNFEQLLQTRGLGPKTVRGLALVSQLIWGSKASHRDPVKYCFAFGGKDGVPYPVNRKSYDEAIQVFEQAIKQSRLGDFEKKKALARLAHKAG